MRVASSAGVHLTYCTNVHPGESWRQVFANMQRFLPEVKARVSPDAPFGVGLRLSAQAARELAQPGRLEDLQAFLNRHGLYVFTINGFPYGAFHNVRVKEQVYLPDWRDRTRLAYTNLLADLLAALLPADRSLSGSISTVPLAFAKGTISEGDVARIVEMLVRHTAHLVEIRERTGHTIALALEPEPGCVLETIADVVEFFGRHLFAEPAVTRLGEMTGLERDGARAALCRHLGVCLDLCHAAVEFENFADAVERLRTAGIAIAKLQISAGLRMQDVTAASQATLRAFDDGVYLHQVVERKAEELRRYIDLEPAFAAFGDDAGREWRVHFHVPVFLAELGEFGTTQQFLLDALALHRERPISQHLEVETYTWDVLPAEHRTGDMAASISRELEWVLWQLAA